jgi:hypothetical protein
MNESKRRCLQNLTLTQKRQCQRNRLDKANLTK